VANLRQIYTQHSLAVRDWATQRLAQLNDYKIQLGQMGQFEPQRLVWSEIQGIGNVSGVNQVLPEIFGPRMLPKRDELLEQLRIGSY